MKLNNSWIVKFYPYVFQPARTHTAINETKKIENAAATTYCTKSSSIK